MGAKTKNRVPQAAAIYCRISLDRFRDDEERKELGVERQQELCQKLAAERGWQVAEVYVDNDRSAYSGKPRPAYLRMLKDLEASIVDGVIAVDQDRLVRRMSELTKLVEVLEHTQVPLVTTAGDLDTTTADGILRLHILGAVAENESRKKSERVAREAEQAARRGVARGSRRPFGFEDDRVTIRAEEAALIRDAADRVLNGDLIPSIARRWNELEIPTTQNAAHGWSAATVAAILRNPRIAGLRTYRGEVIGDAEWAAIIDRETFERLQAKIRRTAKPGRSAKRLLSSIVRCGRCGAPMWASTRDGGPNNRVARYACIKRPGAPGCGATTIVGEPLDQLVTEAVLHRLDSKTVRHALAVKPKRTQKVDVDLAAIERDREDLAADHGAGRITRREWLAARAPLDERLARARQSIDSEEGTAALAPFRDVNVRDRWVELSVERRRAVLNALIDHITIGPSTKTPRFSADRVDIEWRA